MHFDMAGLTWGSLDVRSVVRRPSAKAAIQEVIWLKKSRKVSCERQDGEQGFEGTKNLKR